MPLTKWCLKRDHFMLSWLYITDDGQPFFVGIRPISTCTAACLYTSYKAAWSWSMSLTTESDETLYYFCLLHNSLVVPNNRDTSTIIGTRKMQCVQTTANQAQPILTKIRQTVLAICLLNLNGKNIYHNLVFLVFSIYLSLSCLWFLYGSFTIPFFPFSHSQCCFSLSLLDSDNGVDRVAYRASDTCDSVLFGAEVSCRRQSPCLGTGLCAASASDAWGLHTYGPVFY